MKSCHIKDGTVESVQSTWEKMKEDCALWIKYYFIICSNNALNLDEEFWREKKTKDCNL